MNKANPGAEACGALRRLAALCGGLRRFAEACGALRTLAALCGQLRRTKFVCGRLQKVPVRYRPIAAGQRSPHPHESAHAQGTWKLFKT